MEESIQVRNLKAKTGVNEKVKLPSIIFFTIAGSNCFDNYVDRELEILPLKSVIL